MISTPSKNQAPEIVQTVDSLLYKHSRERAFNRNELMLEPHNTLVFDSFFTNKDSVIWNGNIKGIFGEGETRQVSDICYSFVGFSDFM